MILGPYYEHIGLLVAMEDRRLFDKGKNSFWTHSAVVDSIVFLCQKGEYFVLGIDVERYDPDDPNKYLRGLLKDEIDAKAISAFENYVGVVSSPSVDFENFTYLVNEWMGREPFNFPNPLIIFGAIKRVSVTCF